MQTLRDLVDDVLDFPKPGVLFLDISPLLRADFGKAIDAMSALFSETHWAEIDVIAAIESRGFIFASALAYKHGKGVALIRKAGKLPYPSAQQSFDLEYGSATLEVQAGTGRCLLIDDVLATGGTLAAAADLCTRAGFDIRQIGVFINLSSLNNFSWQGITPRAALRY